MHEGRFHSALEQRIRMASDTALGLISSALLCGRSEAVVRCQSGSCICKLEAKILNRRYVRHNLRCAVRLQQLVNLKLKSQLKSTVGVHFCLPQTEVQQVCKALINCAEWNLKELNRD